MAANREPRTFRVGTYRDGNRYSAYTTWYSPTWNGCIEYDVTATSGAEAKKKAIAMRKAHESLVNSEPKQ